MAASGGKKAILAALFANLGIAIAKFVGFLLTRASSMLAESVHSLADSGNQGLLLLGGARAKRAPTDMHPFGYGRSRYLWSFIVAMVLFALGALFSIYEGVHKLAHPEPIRSVAIAVAILGVGIVLEIFSFRTAIVESNHVRGTQSWWHFIRHAKTPELPVVLLEDLGALVGLVLAMVGVGLAAYTGNPDWDAYGTLAIGSLLAVIAILLAVEMKSLLLGEAASPADVAKIRDAIERRTVCARCWP
ncbi:MAG TPA: cation diffusion facilitator family transporter [Egibacteraceae bacterium]|nr:cation diffusion facilitator family transporter [Egibacteraceae bacterium]